MVPIQFITHSTDKYSYLDSASLAIEGGCRWIQLRMKECPMDEVETVAHQVQNLCKEHDAIFIIDDYVDLAKKLEADGVHLGKNDMPVAQARQQLGEGFLIGGTANTYEDVVSLWQNGVDYIGCGPFRYTTTKKNLSPILGLEGYREIIRRMNEANISLPVVAIGGITREDIPDIMSTGVSGIALSGAILHAENPIREMKEIIHL